MYISVNSMNQKLKKEFWSCSELISLVFTMNTIWTKYKKNNLKSKLNKRKPILEQWLKLEVTTWHWIYLFFSRICTFTTFCNTKSVVVRSQQNCICNLTLQLQLHKLEQFTDLKSYETLWVSVSVSMKWL